VAVHLRNHGFVLGENGWRLAPAFDVNPNIDKAEHVLNIDDAESIPSLTTVLTTAQFYGLTTDRGRKVVEEVVSAVNDWREIARLTGITAADVDLTAGAFSAHSEHRGT
jgi:serine/threonine-protein kinase HipA